MTDTEVLKSQNSQRKAAKKKLYASFESLSAKPRAIDEFEVVIDQATGPETFLFEACGGDDYDALLTKFPPTSEQKARGLTFNPKKFAPALLAEVCQLPKLDAAQWTAILKGQNWSGGESGFLYDRAIQLCIKGLDPTPTAAG
jgi:hypothetical protein